ncbi:flavin reductase family protein [Candidatus Mycobacterium methanotrophicum]|uniref:Flavin reductase family protein n=1 Tax=Candidatus Mycobacterium methanotrophicum TaxID=2943498 RepID=A0ABY4QNK7_9MYCO|nr:flavin reductase family protein [Candidatus Mycobacterium methanotrophicum]UQX11842.1 flavin reductase family protein [Candidatus Mycobacterium methanotrophicum]
MLGDDGDVGDDSFDRLVGMLDYTMFVVTTQADGHPSGCLVGFATQTSMRPVRFLVGLSKNNHTTRVAARSDHLAVHVLARRHIGLAHLFGGQTGDQVDKFDHCSWRTGPEGMPILDDAVAWFVGRTLKRFDLGDHIGYLLAPLTGDAVEAANDLVSFSDVADMEPGHQA